MSGNVGGQDGNQINIKLYNGKTVNLKKLDKLIGQASTGSVFANFDAADKGGNANNVFDEAEIAQIKNMLLQYQASDNNVSQDELNNMFGYGQLDEKGNKKNFNVNNLTSLLDSIPDDEPQVQQSVKDTPPPTENKILTNYTVQPGDTPKKIAEKFGLQGEEAQSFIKHLQTQTDKKGWFAVGQKITLLGEHSEKIKNMADYSEDTTTLNTRWSQTESGKRAIAQQQRKQEQVSIPDAISKRAAEITKGGGKCKIVRNNDGGFSIIQTSGGNYMKNHKISGIELRYDKNGNMISQINNYQNGSVVEGKWANGKMNWKTTKKALELKPTNGKKAAEDMTPQERAQHLLPREWNWPENLKIKVINFRQQGIECTVTKTRNGYTINLNEDAQNIKRLLNPDWKRLMTPEFMRDKKTLVIDKDGNLVQQNQAYNNRTVVTRYFNGKAISSQTQYKKYVSYNAVDTQRKVKDSVATGIDINRPEHLNEEGSRFANSLESNKAALMKILGLTNEQYNNLANIAMGIAEQETHFGATSYTTRSGEYQIQWRNMMKDGADTLGLIDAAYDLGIKKGTKSSGMTQVKLGDFEHIKKQFEAFGITSNEALQDNPEKQAIATIIALNNKRLVAQGETWQKLLADNNAKITDTNEQITENDLIALLYNGNSKVLNRFKDPNDVVKISDTGKNHGTSYARNVRVYTEHYYSVAENMHSRNRANALGAESQGNNGKLGTVIFMPTAYTTDVTNNKEDIKILETALADNPNIPQEDKDKLLMAVRKNEIAFGYGLTPDEAASITAKDAKLMLDKLTGLKSRVANLVDPAKIRKEAQATQDSFRDSYLQSRQVLVNDHDVSAGSIIPALNSGDVVNERLVEKRETVVTSYHRDGRGGGARRAIARDTAAVEAGNYKGFAVQQDLGVNPYDANGNYIPKRQRELAEFASDVAADMGTGGLCLTGVKAAFESAGVTGKNEVVYPKGHKDWGKPIEEAKDLVYYLKAHPEKFEEVKYVSLGNGTSRELNASDIKNLPAGYIGVFIPGAGYEEQAGHAFITNGNGQGYADEVDNLRWDDFKSAGAGSGKGEHGTYKIYRLKV